MKIQDLTGEKFGRWTVVSLFDKVRYDYGTSGGCTVARWLCRCECGAEKVVRGLLLKNGSSRSCGCYQKDFQRERNTKHGMVGTAEYAAWAHMMDRCKNPKNPEYKNYGARGITVCERWKDASNFLADMGRRPSASHELERINNDLGYSHDNCKWATRPEQCSNQRRSKRLRFNGRVQSVAQWAKEIGIKASTLRNRIADGWTTADALTLPVSQDKGGWKTRRVRHAS